MKYQLRRMVLVNAGTNKHVPSNRITAIDPRGGAAVLGDNGVGKTTTLRILPLFFGHLPSQLVSGQGQEPMVRFVLPTDASAIAFEYDRGSDKEEDRRMVVIRRRADDHDIPFYRLYRCGFRKELFVDEGRFLDDEETQKRATAMLVQTTSKLTTAEYRSVILRTPATSKEKERLRRYSLEWSFGPKQLDNLDRLVAAMVKKHINFSDIVQVAVGLVQQDLGHGSERAKLTFKQGRAHIERWLKNRDACADAFKLAPSIAVLEDDLAAHRAAEARFRARRADVAAVTAARTAEKTALAKAIEELTAAWTTSLETQATERGSLALAASQASAAAFAAKTEYEEQNQLGLDFDAQRAAHWEPLVQDLPTLRLTKKTLQEQVLAAHAEHTDATATYARMTQEVRTEAGARASALELEKQPYRDRLETTRGQISAAEASARADAQTARDDLHNQLSDSLEPLLQEQGAWAGRKEAPAASAEALNELQLANDRLASHNETCGAAAKAFTDLETTARDLKLAFTAQEEATRTAKSDLAMAGTALDAARLLLAPAPGTLLAALRESGDEDWKRTLAKVINPELLDRSDLDPVAMEEAATTVYGWRLATGVISTPEWVDDAEKAVALAEARVAAAKLTHETLLEGLAGKSRAMTEAEDARGVARAQLSVLEGQSESLKTTLAGVKHRVELEKREAVTKATAELARLKTAVDAIRAQMSGLKSQLARDLDAIQKLYDAQRADAKKLQDESIAAIQASIDQLSKATTERIASIEEQLAEHLTSKGVDVKRLAELNAKAKEVAEQVREREDKEALVSRWRIWLTAGGATRVATLRSAAEQAHESARQKSQLLTEFDDKATKARLAHENLLAAKNNRLSDVDDDLIILDALVIDFGDYLATGQSVIDIGISARELRGKATADRTALSTAEDSVKRRSSSLLQQLTAKDTAVRELIEVSMERVANGSIVARAAELCVCFKLIGPQIATDVNNTLKTLLANIGAFQKSIHTFEREVGAFNSRLQAGLNEVRCFERIKDLRLDIVTNFDNLGFYKKLKRMDDIVRLHANERRDYSRELPPDETARALGDFMSVLGTDGTVEVNLSSQITLNGAVTDNGQRKEFKRASELENISSEGLTSLILITLMTALLNTIRGAEPVYVPWVTDEVGKFDPTNFKALMQMLSENRIDVVTASPELGAAQHALFSQRYMFEDLGVIREYAPRVAPPAAPVPAPATEVAS